MTDPIEGIIIQSKKKKKKKKKKKQKKKKKKKKKKKSRENQYLKLIEQVLLKETFEVNFLLKEF